MNIEPIAYFTSPFASKFGIPKQSGLVEELRGRITFVAKWRNADVVRGLEEFDYVWLIWGFSANKHSAPNATVRPPLLGGNTRMGVFATRSPFRPNTLGLSCVKILGIEHSAAHGPEIIVGGADLMNGTPIYDIKPYVAFADSHPNARSGFVDSHELERLKVVMPDKVAHLFSDNALAALRRSLELDPRPHYQKDENRVYGMPFGGFDIHFKVSGKRLVVIDGVPV